MIYLIDPQCIKLDGRCWIFCKTECPLDNQPLYGIPFTT